MTELSGTFASLDPVGPLLGCLPRGGANLCTFVCSCSELTYEGVGVRICTWFFGAFRAGRCEFERGWSSLNGPPQCLKCFIFKVVVCGKFATQRAGRSRSVVRFVFPVLVLQLSKQQNRTPLRTVLGHRNSPQKSFEVVALLVGFSPGNPLTIGTFTAWNRTRNRPRTPLERFLSLRSREIQHSIDPRLCHRTKDAVAEGRRR